jgi:hypothetical protein
MSIEFLNWKASYMRSRSVYMSKLNWTPNDNKLQPVLQLFKASYLDKYI